MQFRNVAFRLEGEVVRLWYRWSGGRPSSAPFLSGDGFRALTPWRYENDTRSTFEPTKVPPGSLVFCDSWLLEEFLKGPAAGLPAGTRLISANGDPNFTLDKLAWIPASISHLWVQNCEVADPRVSPLPIGLENARLHVNGIAADFVRLRKGFASKRSRILWGFAEGNNPVERGKARVALEATSLADKPPFVNARAYRKRLSNYQFVASPPGNGSDCHRTWEAMYLRVVPIVVRSIMTEHYASLGLPLWLVDSYQELNALTAEDLDRKYRELSPGFDGPALWMDFWKEAVSRCV